MFVVSYNGSLSEDLVSNIITKIFFLKIWSAIFFTKDILSEDFGQ